jgi:hypothetical protein
MRDRAAMFDLAHRNGVAVLPPSRPPVNAISTDLVAGFQALLERPETRERVIAFRDGRAKPV